MLLLGNICRKRSHTAPEMSFTVWTTVWMVSKSLKTKRLAERVGFEPTLEFPLNTLSKRAPSATRPSLRRRLGHTHYTDNYSQAHWRVGEIQIEVCYAEPDPRIYCPSRSVVAR